MKKTFSYLAFAVPALAAALAIGMLVPRDDAPQVEYLTGVVETTEIDVVPKIPGRISDITVREGDRVTRGQLVATLESKEIDAKVEQARGALQAAQAKLRMAHNGARPEEREAVERLYQQARHQFDLADKTYRRVQKVFDEGLIAEQERDQARFKYDAAREQMEAARAQYQMVMKGARAEDVQAAEGLVHQAESATREATAYQQETSLMSPIAGEVVERVADPGEVVAAGYPVLTIIAPDDAWVVVQVREDELGSLRMGTRVSAIVPGLGGQAVPFRVTHVAPMADFATWRATNQKGDFDLRTFEVHLRPERLVDGLRPGMTVRIPVASRQKAK